MESETDNRIRVSTREFREKLRDYVDIVRTQDKEVILQSNKKDMAALISYERLTELLRKAGELEDNQKPSKTRRRPQPFNSKPSACSDAII